MLKKKHLILAATGLALLVGCYVWFEASTRPHAAPKPDAGVAAVGQIPAGDGSPVSVPEMGVVTVSEGELAEAAPSAAGDGQAAAAASHGPTVGDILAEPDEDYVRVAKKLASIALNPRAPMVEREEALAHTINLSAGNEAEVLTPMVKDPNLPDELAETILAEALNRPLAYQADLYLVALAERKDPELQTKIREHLAFLTGGDDKGANPADWIEPLKAAKAEWPQ